MQTVAMWRDLIQALGNAGMGSAAVDLRGHGNSDSCEALEDAGIEDYAVDAKSCGGLVAIFSFQVFLALGIGDRGNFSGHSIFHGVPGGANNAGEYPSSTGCLVSAENTQANFGAR